MSTYKVGIKASTKELEVIPGAAALSAGFTLLGSFDHADLFTGAADADDTLDAGGHVIWHDVRDLLYAAGHLDPSAFKLKTRGPVTAIDATPATSTKAAGQTTQIAVATTPANALDQRVTYSSSDPAKATVNASGLVSFVATGSATITVKHVETGVTDTVAITVS